MSFKKNLYPLNPLDIKIANKHEPEFFAQEFHPEVAVAALVDGAITVEVESNFGLDEGKAYGASLLDNGVAAGEVVGISVAPSATSGKLTVTLSSSDVNSTTALSLINFWVYGRPTTQDYSY